ncbi:hypothetical protein V6H71_001640 [Campylobacter jejuni]
MKKLGLVLAVLVALNVSAFADLIVINKKDLVPVSAIKPLYKSKSFDT